MVAELARRDRLITGCQCQIVTSHDVDGLDPILGAIQRRNEIRDIQDDIVDRTERFVVFIGQRDMVVKSTDVIIIRFVLRSNVEPWLLAQFLTGMSSGSSTHASRANRDV